MRITPGGGAHFDTQGAALAYAWDVLGGRGAPGLIVLDLDVVIDPGDLAAMYGSSYEHPADVLVAPVKLWPASTGRAEWIWAHRGGSLGSPAATQDEDAPIAYFTPNCTYMPARLLDAARPGLPGWEWPRPEVELSELALHLGIPARLVPACRPKHLHF